MRKRMKLSYSPTADALYISFGRKWRSYRTKEMSKGYSMRLVDYSKEGEPIGVEILGTRYGIDVSGLPREEELPALLRQHGFELLSANDQKRRHGIPPLRGIRPEHLKEPAR